MAEPGKRRATPALISLIRPIGINCMQTYVSRPPSSSTETLLCLSHLRWNFVFQRPQHLMSRFARERRVFYWEEPIYEPEGPQAAAISRTCPQTAVIVVTPHLPERHRQQSPVVLASLLSEFVEQQGIDA